MVEQRIRNAKVGGSTPLSGTRTCEGPQQCGPSSRLRASPRSASDRRECPAQQARRPTRCGGPCGPPPSARRSPPPHSLQGLEPGVGRRALAAGTEAGGFEHRLQRAHVGDRDSPGLPFGERDRVPIQTEAPAELAEDRLEQSPLTRGLRRADPGQRGQFVPAAPERTMLPARRRDDLVAKGDGFDATERGPLLVLGGARAGCDLVPVADLADRIEVIPQGARG